jgi:hypothetical protein
MTPGLCMGLAHGNNGVFTKGYDSCVNLEFCMAIYADREDCTIGQTTRMSGLDSRWKGSVRWCGSRPRIKSETFTPNSSLCSLRKMTQYHRLVSGQMTSLNRPVPDRTSR